MSLRWGSVACLASLVACTLRAPRIDNSGRPCSNDAQCNGDVCYAGSCRTRANQLGSIYAEVRAADPQLGLLQVGSIDPRRSPVVEFHLVPALSVTGEVLQAPEPTQPGNAFSPVPNASVVLTDLDGGIPGRTQSISTSTDTSGNYAATISVSSWSVAARIPTSPPVLDGGVLTNAVTTADVILPAKADQSSLSASIVSGDTGVGGLSVLALSPGGDALGPTATTASDGSFRLLLPPHVATYSLQIGPQNPSATIPTFNPRIITPPQTPTVIDIGPLPAPTSLSGRVVDMDGGPVTHARVQATSTDVTGWTMSRQADVDPSGSFTLLLVEGNYVVEAVPDPTTSLPALSGEIPVGLDAGIAGTNMGLITCPPKVHAKGSLLTPDGGSGGPEYQIVASRLPDRLVTGRAGTATSTDSTGAFDLIGDSGEYRLTVLPTPESNLPLTYAVVELSGTTLPAISVAPGVEVIGTVFGAQRTPIPSATVEFFALGSNGQRAVSIGSALTDANGFYRVVLPDVPNPAGP